MAKRPLTFNSVLACWKKFSCLFLVEVQKSCVRILIFLLQITVLGDDGSAALFAERRIGHHDAESLAWVAGKAVPRPRTDRARVGVNAAQVEVHDAQAGRVRDQFPALDRTWSAGAVSGPCLAPWPDAG